MSKQTLILVEGEDKDVDLIKHLFEVYLPNSEKTIIVYKTDIYSLYAQIMDEEGDEFGDLLMHLREHEKDASKKEIFNSRFNEVFLIFDFDPQDPLFTSEKLQRMMIYFNDATNTRRGRLYINYPMVESFFHIKSWNENQEDFNNRHATKYELWHKKYKERVEAESCCTDIQQFDKDKFNKIIDMNLTKALYLLNQPKFVPFECNADMLRRVSEVECCAWDEKGIVYVLNTCVLYMYENYPKKVILNVDDCSAKTSKESLNPLPEHKEKENQQ